MASLMAPSSSGSNSAQLEYLLFLVMTKHLTEFLNDSKFATKRLFKVFLSIKNGNRDMWDPEILISTSIHFHSDHIPCRGEFRPHSMYYSAGISVHFKVYK